MSIWGEIKRRKVFQVAAVYAVVAWLLIQIVATVEEPLSLPDWFDTSVIVLMAVGFPITLIISWAFNLTPEGLVRDQGGRAQSAGRTIEYFLIGLVLIAVGWVIYRVELATDSAIGPPRSITRAAATTRVELTLDVPTAGFGRRIAISPDGRWIAYAGGESAISTRLFVRRADELEVRAVPGTVGARSPDFSPDSEWIVFTSGKGLMKVRVEGGPAIVLHTGQGTDPSWGRDGFVYFDGGLNSTRINRVPESGGQVETLLETNEAVGQPVPLPDGSGVLFTTFRSLGDSDVPLLDLETGEERALVSPGVHARYVPSGHLVYGHASGALMAVPFDLERHEVTGDPVPVIPRVDVSRTSGDTQFAVSDAGTALYLTGSSLSGLRLALVSLTGAVDLLPVTAAPTPALTPRFSPDGGRIAFQDRGQIHVFDLELGTNAPLTFAGRNQYQVWSPDGAFLVFRSATRGLMRVATDGSAPAEALATPGIEGNPEAWSHDGAVLLYRNPADLQVLHLGESVSSAPYLVSEWNEYAAALSPDGRFAAYASDESGAFEVYVRTFPTPGARYQVSVDGGVEPVWAPEASRIYYRQRDTLQAARIELEPQFHVLGRETVLSDLSDFPRWEFSASYDVHPDGDRFVFFTNGRDAGEGDDAVLTVVTNWFEELSERMSQ
jgi:Tol biopolymer transport system component